MSIRRLVPIAVCTGKSRRVRAGTTTTTPLPPITPVITPAPAPIKRMKIISSGGNNLYTSDADNFKTG
jgi:hypothetical protein